MRLFCSSWIFHFLGCEVERGDGLAHENAERIEGLLLFGLGSLLLVLLRRIGVASGQGQGADQCHEGG
jgi:hypothetical protein